MKATVSRAKWQVILSAALALTLAAVGCSAEGSRDSRRKVSTSRVLYADSVLGPLHPAQDIVITVEATATQDPGKGFWTYSYTVMNEPISQNALETFLVRPMWKPERILSPAHWMGSYGSEGDSTAVAWHVVDFGPDPPGWDGVQLYQGPYHPTPGQSTSGFSIVSRQPPTIISFYAQGFDTLQWGGEEDVLSAPGIFEEGVTGTTIGPDINNPVGIGESKQTETPVRFLPPAPNPASSSVNFAYYLPEPAEVTLSIFNASGQQVTVLKQGHQPAGYHSTNWNGLTSDGRRAATGVYFYRLTVDGKSVGARKVVIIK